MNWYVGQKVVWVSTIKAPTKEGHIQEILTCSCGAVHLVIEEWKASNAKFTCNECLNRIAFTQNLGGNAKCFRPLKDNFKVGEKVWSPTWGDGEVVSIREQLIDVMFESTRKGLSYWPDGRYFSSDPAPTLFPIEKKDKYLELCNNS